MCHVTANGPGDKESLALEFGVFSLTGKNSFEIKSYFIENIQQARPDLSWRK